MTTTINATQRRLERAWVQQASPFPTARPRRTWLILAAGIGIGVLLGAGSRWLITPIAPQPAVVEKPRCKFDLPPISEERLASMQPVYPPDLARRWAPGGDLHQHLGEQGPSQAQLQQSQPEPPRETSECVR
jgi:hypothetical protein